jgi:predicted methyltransferase
MKTVQLPFLLLALALLVTACSGLSKVDPLRLVTSGRDGWQHPERVIEALALGPGDRVADIGAGDGYFVPWLSRAVGPTGRVYAVEVDDDSVAALRALVAEQGLANVLVVRGLYDDPQLPDGEVDLALTCLTYHHIEGRPGYFQRLLLDLSPRGRVAHLDDRDDLTGILGMMVTEGHYTNVDSMRVEMQEAGYARVASYDFLPTQSFEIFAPVAFQARAARGPQE